MVDAIIFDMDGTLLDSVDLHAQAWQEAFAHFGYDFEFSRIRSQIGKGGDQLLPVFLSPEELKTKGKQISEYRSDLFKRKFLPQVKPFPGVRDLFERIAANGQKLGIASSSKGDELSTFERIAGIEDLVHAHTSSADAERSKPYPDIFEAALSRLGDGVKKQNVIVVGDSPHDAEAAKRAGLRTVGVRCGGFPETDLRNAGCVAIFDGPEDLLNRYYESPLARA
ncbi:MAG: HAD family phosphatase [Acidobacteriaceae bacterium]|nr:HAD family phosphatase [Acidobacteriaceae bacterium]